MVDGRVRRQALCGIYENSRGASYPTRSSTSAHIPGSTLDVIHDFMRREAEAGWRERLVRKATIEEALGDYNTLLDDAARSFQACSTSV